MSPNCKILLSAAYSILIDLDFMTSFATISKMSNKTELQTKFLFEFQLLAPSSLFVGQHPPLSPLQQK
jgi:hypothetical protein